MEAGLLHVHRLTPDSGDRAPGRGRVVSPVISTSHLQVIAGARERERICESPHPRVCVCVCTCAYTRASSSVVSTTCGLVGACTRYGIPHLQHVCMWVRARESVCVCACPCMLISVGIRVFFCGCGGGRILVREGSVRRR